MQRKHFGGWGSKVKCHSYPECSLGPYFQTKKPPEGKHQIQDTVMQKQDLRANRQIKYIVFDT